MRPLTIKVPRQLEERIDRLARTRGVARSVVVREALEAYAAKPQRSALDVLGDFVGSVRGGPRDLATNPKHMEGFGEYRPPRRKRHRRSAQG